MGGLATNLDLLNVQDNLSNMLTNINNNLVSKIDTIDNCVSNQTCLELVSYIDHVKAQKDAGLEEFHGVQGIDFSEDGRESENLEYDHVFHFGSMDWEPNVHGVSWLVDEVWPIVRKEIPKAELVLAGRNMPPGFSSNTTAGISVIGEVHDASKFLKRSGIMTIPLHSGSGMRIKAVEGMAAGKPTVSTHLGVCGLGLTEGKHALIADDAAGCASNIIILLQDSNKARNIAESGKKHIREHFSNKKIIRLLIEFLRQL